MSWRPTSPDVLPGRLADWLAESPGIVRVAIDGPPCAAPDALADRLLAPLRALGRPGVHVPASSFWRDASLRLERGREDPESYRSWLDADAVRREVLTRAVEAGSYLPSLRDPFSNRATREAPRPVEEGTVLIVSGAFLLACALPFDRTVHLGLSPAARARRTEPGQAWTLPAFDAYDADSRPLELADVAVKLDDPRHPAVQWRT